MGNSDRYHITMKEAGKYPEINMEIPKNYLLIWSAKVIVQPEQNPKFA